MDRLEIIRTIFDEKVASIQKSSTRNFAYIHTYGVSQFAALLSKLRNENVELACIAAMLHDIALYLKNCPHSIHAQKSAIIAKEILEDTNLFKENEINQICHAIHEHSNKRNRYDTPLAETLKDADVLAHHLYNINITLSPSDSYRLYYLMEILHNQDQSY